MPPALSSPGFIVALAILLANDLWWKAAYGNWLTGKLSDFAGLFLVVVLATAFRPANGRAIAVVAAVGFTLWKSPLSQPLIDLWNATALYRIARVVDYSDLLALIIVPAARHYVAIARPLAPAALRYPIVAVALVAILGTSKAQPGWLMSQADRIEYFPFLSQPVIFEVAAPRAEVLDRLHRAGFKVETELRVDNVEILSGVSCRTPTGDRRLVNGLFVLQSDGPGSTIDLRHVYLCRRDRPWDRKSAAAVFESEVLESVGNWRRQP